MLTLAILGVVGYGIWRVMKLPTAMIVAATDAAFTRVKALFSK